MKRLVSNEFLATVLGLLLLLAVGMSRASAVQQMTITEDSRVEDSIRRDFNTAHAKHQQVLEDLAAAEAKAADERAKSQADAEEQREHDAALKSVMVKIVASAKSPSYHQYTESDADEYRDKDLNKEFLSLTSEQMLMANDKTGFSIDQIVGVAQAYYRSTHR